jgi:hypothetical protein
MRSSWSYGTSSCHVDFGLFNPRGRATKIHLPGIHSLELHISYLYHIPDVGQKEGEEKEGGGEEENKVEPGSEAAVDVDDVDLPEDLKSAKTSECLIELEVLLCPFVYLLNLHGCILQANFIWEWFSERVECMIIFRLHQLYATFDTQVRLERIEEQLATLVSAYESAQNDKTHVAENGGYGDAQELASLNGYD